MWSQRRKTKPGTKHHWDERKKLEVLQSFIVIGNMTKAAALNNVPLVTVNKWKTTQWWRDTEEELRRSSKLQLSAKLSDLVNRTMVELADRVKNGDYMLSRSTGEWVRKPISAEHASKITGQLIDRALAVEKAAKPERITDEGLEQRLLKLRAEMLTFARAKTLIKPPNPKDIIDVVSSEPISQLEGPQNDSPGNRSGADQRSPDPARAEGLVDRASDQSEPEGPGSGASAGS